MRLKNTSTIPTEQVRECINVAKGCISLKGVYVKVTDTKKPYIGRCWATGSILVRTSPDNKYPLAKNNIWIDYNGNRHKVRFPKYKVNDRLELLVAILAHEFQHLRIFRKRRKWAWANYGKKCPINQSEIKCERYAQKRVNRWRVLKGG